ncbi:MAG: adenosylcobinamide-GDP ribazoletransferase [Methanosarcinales archaeon]|nr:MAG: adenosylcobinamide-GDP ribazoletransferase [Methanosarcinales archaeon]
MKDFFLALQSCFGFLSTIRVGNSMNGIDALMRHIYLFTVGGAVIGVIAGGIGYATSLYFKPAVTAFITLAVLYYLTGINHLDGLADVGDGIMVQGDSKRKIEVMKDVATGAGGVFFVTLALIGTYTAIFTISQTNHILPAIIVGEVCAKHGMLTTSFKAKKIHEGLGSMNIDSTTSIKYMISLAIALAVCTTLYHIYGIIAIIISSIAAITVRSVANKHFGGVNGDVIGATNEVARIAALFTLGGVTSWTLL